MADRSESFTLGAIITAPSGKQVAKVQLTRKAKSSEKGRVEKGFLPLGFYNCKFEEAGEHHVEILINNNSVHYIPLTIQVRKPHSLPKKKSV
jgi:hypothetical protein